MYASRLFIQNYRSIKRLDLRLHPGKNVIVGRNNAGKSNIIKALDIVLGESSPDYAKAENVTTRDFHTVTEQGEKGSVVKIADEIFIWCEITRPAEEALNYEELDKCFGFYRCDSERHGPPMRFDTLPETYDDAFGIDPEQQDKTYIKTSLRNQKSMESEFGDKYMFAIGFKASRAEGVISKEARLFYKESAAHHWIMAFKASVRNELLQTAIVHSFRDPQQQLRLSAWTWYGKLMRHLTENHDQMDALKTAYDHVATVSNGIFKVVKDRVTDSALKISFPGTEISFQLNPDTEMELYKSCLIYVDDGFKSLLTEKGSGIQSATIIGLFTYYVHNVNTITSALLCVEEPELYLHPHARRVISGRLTEFLGAKNQVVLTTHSAEFLRSDGRDLHVIAVRHLRETGTTSIGVDLKDFADILVDEASNELFFADRVIICEGFDNFVVRAVAQALFPGELDAQNVSVISVGGKDRISKMAKLVRRLHLDCFVVADFDYLLRDKGEEREPYHAKAHESVGNLTEAFLKQPCIFGELEGSKMAKLLQKLRADIKSGDPKGFYTATRTTEVQHPDLTNVLQECRARGLCILSGQIEDLFTDGSFNENRKLTLAGIFDLNQRIVDGEDLLNILNPSDLEPFLKHVLKGPNAPPAAKAGTSINPFDLEMVAAKFDAMTDPEQEPNDTRGEPLEASGFEKESSEEVRALAENPVQSAGQ